MCPGLPHQVHSLGGRSPGPYPKMYYLIPVGPSWRLQRLHKWPLPFSALAASGSRPHRASIFRCEQGLGNQPHENCPSPLPRLATEIIHHPRSEGETDDSPQPNPSPSTSSLPLLTITEMQASQHRAWGMCLNSSLLGSRWDRLEWGLAVIQVEGKQRGNRASASTQLSLESVQPKWDPETCTKKGSSCRCGRSCN